MTAISAAMPVAADLGPVVAEALASPGFAQLITALFPAAGPADVEPVANPARESGAGHAAPKADEDAEPEDAVDLIAWQLLPTQPVPTVATVTLPPAPAQISPPAGAPDERPQFRSAAGTPSEAVGVARASTGLVATLAPALPITTPLTPRAVPVEQRQDREPKPTETSDAVQPALAASLELRPSQQAAAQAHAVSPIILQSPASQPDGRPRFVSQPGISAAPVTVPPAAAVQPVSTAAGPVAGAPPPPSNALPRDLRPAPRERPATARLRLEPLVGPEIPIAAAGPVPMAEAPQRADASTRTLPSTAEAAPRIAARVTDAAPGGFDIATDQLGAVRVTIDAREARVAVQLSADTTAAGQLLAAHPSRLADAVASGGQRLDALAVDVRSGGGQGGRQSPDPRPQSSARPMSAPAPRPARADRFA